MKRTVCPIVAAMLMALTFVPDAPATTQQAKCLAAKTNCMAKKAARLLECEARAETPGKPADPNAKDCVTKAQTRFGGGLEPNKKGCFEKLEAKDPNDCLTVDDTGAAETAVDTCVAALVAAIDPPPLDQTRCGAGKKKCASKYLTALLKCRKLAQRPGKPTDPNTKGCVDKAVAKYTGGDDPTRGCFAKLEAKDPNDCQSTTDSPTVQALVEDCVDDLVAVVAGCEPKLEDACNDGAQECGQWDVGCGVFVPCGDCNPGGIGFRRCVDGQCCQPTVTGCVILSGSCGYRVDDGCGRTLTCTCASGTCVDGQCAGSGPCIPSCADAQCGDDDRCGGYCFGSCPGSGQCISFGSAFGCVSIETSIPDCDSVQCGFCDSGGAWITKACANGADCDAGDCGSGGSLCNRPCNAWETCNDATGECMCCRDNVCTTCNTANAPCIGKTDSSGAPIPGTGKCCFLTLVNSCLF